MRFVKVKQKGEKLFLEVRKKVSEVPKKLVFYNESYDKFITRL